MITIEKLILIKPSLNKGKEKYIYPVISANIVYYNEEMYQTVNDKLD